MSDVFDIRVYQPGDEAGIRTSFNRVFRDVCGAGYVDRPAEFWDWEFGRNPAGHRITVAAIDGNIAAHYGGIPQVAHTEFGAAVFVHIVDSFVVPEHRAGLKRPGLFVRTALPWFDLCRDHGDAILYGYPVKTAERVGTRYLEYHFLQEINYLLRSAQAGSDVGPEAVSVERATVLAAEVDELFGRLAEQQRCWVKRDREYLQWRYLEPPYYEVYLARRDTELVGLMVLRPVHDLVPDSCTIADWLAPVDDAEVTDALLSVATRRARELERQHLLCVFATPSAEHKALVARGFEVAPSSRWMERRLTYRSYNERMTGEWLRDAWWYSLGDSDLV